jgi:arylamine N-acetyltransferase
MVQFPAQPRSPPQQQWQRQEAMSATDSSTWPNSYLFSPEFKPAEDLLTVDADDNFWYYFNHDVSTAQRVLAQARDTQHSRGAGMEKLLKVERNCHDSSQRQDLAAVLKAFEKVSGCRTGLQSY